eukprot:g3888.t1
MILCDAICDTKCVFQKEKRIVVAEDDDDLAKLLVRFNYVERYSKPPTYPEAKLLRKLHKLLLDRYGSRDEAERKMQPFRGCSAVEIKTRRTEILDSIQHELAFVVANSTKARAFTSQARVPHIILRANDLEKEGGGSEKEKDELSSTIALNHDLIHELVHVISGACGGSSSPPRSVSTSLDEGITEFFAQCVCNAMQITVHEDVRATSYPAQTEFVRILAELDGGFESFFRVKFQGVSKDDDDDDDNDDGSALFVRETLAMSFAICLRRFVYDTCDQLEKIVIEMSDGDESQDNEKCDRFIRCIRAFVRACETSPVKERSTWKMGDCRAALRKRTTLGTLRPDLGELARRGTRMLARVGEMRDLTFREYLNSVRSRVAQAKAALPVYFEQKGRSVLKTTGREVDIWGLG